MGIGIGQFLHWKNGIQASGTGVWSLGMGIKSQNSKIGMGFEHCEVGF